MRSFPALLAAVMALATAGSSPAQPAGVTVELVLDENTYLPGEDIPVGVRISNLSGRPLTFGSSNSWLTFYAESKSGTVIGRLGQVPVEGEFTLESSKAGTKWWNIQPYFDFQKAGLHQVYAEIRVPGWSERVLSEPATFTLQSARKLWEIAFGVPPSDGNTNAQPEIRRYALQSAIRTRDRNLYARVTNQDETHIFRVVFLDRLLTFANPEQQLDSQSRLHVLLQTGGNTYTYCVVSPDGELAVRQKHEIVTGSRPRLVKMNDGDIAVGGGRRLPSSSDIPPYVAPKLESRDPATSTNTTSTVTSTNAPAEKLDSKSKRRRERRSSTTPKSP